MNKFEIIENKYCLKTVLKQINEIMQNDDQ